VVRVAVSGKLTTKDYEWFVPEVIPFPLQNNYVKKMAWFN
jgi:hypothetical protein